MAVQDTIDRAVALHRRGAVEVAITLYSVALSESDNHPTVANLLAIALDQSGRPDEAERVLEGALGQVDGYDPAFLEPTLNLARLRVRRDAADDALAPARRAAQLEAEQAQDVAARGLFLGLAIIQGERNLVLEAGRFLVGDAAGRSHFLQVIMGLGEKPFALDLVRLALEQRGDDPLFQLMAGHFFASRGEIESAVAHGRHALLLEPAIGGALIFIGVESQKIGLSAIALVAFSRAVCADPTNPDAWNNLASAIKPRQQWKEAGVAYQRSLVLQPNSGDSWRNLGVLLADMADMTGGRLAYRRALAIRPDDVGLAFKAAMTFPTIVGSDVEIDSIRLRIIRDLDQLVKRGTLIDDPLLEVGLPNFYLAYHGRNDRDIQTKIARAYLVLSPGLAWCAPHCVVPMPRNPLRRIRIGFFSVFFHDHSIRYVAEGVVQKLDRSRFEVFLITDVGPLDVAPFPPHEVPDRHLEVPHDLGVARKIIANAALDILVYCDIGMEPMSYYLAFARLAPVQCVMQGHPVTTGIPNVDYFLSSAWMEPDDFHEHYSETCVQLPELTFHYLREPEATPGTRSDYGLPEVGSLYFCPQTLFKFHPHFDKMLRDILERDPTGWLILLKDYSESRTQELAKRLRSSLCKAADRVIWLDRMSRPKYYTLLMLSDVMLDTPYFSGGNTTVQSLALGVPTVTYASPHVRGRVTIGWARVLNCMDLVARTAADYARIAVGCATDSAFRGSVQKRMLVNRGALFQRPDVVREYASFLESALDSALAGVSSAIDCDDDADGVA